jgi:hypothetical protein
VRSPQGILHQRLTQILKSSLVGYTTSLPCRRCLCQNSLPTMQTRPTDLPSLDNPNPRLVSMVLLLHQRRRPSLVRTWYPFSNSHTGAANRIAQIISLKVDPDAARPPGIHDVSHRELQAFVQIAKALYVMERLMISGTPSRPVMIADMDFFYDQENTIDSAIAAINSPVDDPFRMSNESPHVITLLSVWEHISLFEREGFVDLDPPPWNSQSRFQELRQMLDDWMLRLPKDLQFSSETLSLRISEGKGAQLVFLHWYVLDPR